MPVNLLNEKDLNNYLADIVYHGQEMEVFKSGDFKSTAFVEQNKDAIVRSMLLQWCKHRLRSHLSEDLPEHRDFLKQVKDNEPDLPSWAERCLKEGNAIHRFEADKIPAKLTEDIGMIRDYLYSAAESYINKTLARVKDTNAKSKEEVSPKLRIDYLKTQEAYDTFAKTLDEAQKWHDIMAEKAEKKKRDEEMYKASLSGTHSVMKLANGMEIVQLTTPEALDYESEYMGHCVGKGEYDKGVANGKIKIYSLRDAYGMPHATLEVRKDNDKEEIHQCKGKGNKAPIAEYRPYLQEFINAQNFEIAADHKNIGLVKIYDTKTKKTQYYDVNKLNGLPKDREYVVKGDLDLSGMNLDQLPDLSNFTVEGSFNCSNNNLTSLKGAPQKVSGNYQCDKNHLTSLIGAPKKVGGWFWCSYNELTSLEGAPEEVGGSFHCSYNEITSLIGAPEKVCGSFNCYNNRLTNLEGAPREVKGVFDCSYNRLTSLTGGPQEVGGDYNCNHNQLTTLEGAPQKVGINFGCSHNQLTTLKGAPQKVGSGFFCNNNQLTSLTGAPQEVSIDFYCNDNQLTDLEGAPQKIGRDFSCNNNRLLSLRGAPQKISGNFYCNNNQLTSLKGLPQIVGRGIECMWNPLKSFKYLPTCECVASDINPIYDPDILHSEFDNTYSPYCIIKKNPRFIKEKQEVLDEKRAEVYNKIKRNEAAKNISPTKGEVKSKRTGIKKQVAKINIMLAQIKQSLKRNSKAEK